MIHPHDHPSIAWADPRTMVFLAARSKSQVATKRHVFKQGRFHETIPFDHIKHYRAWGTIPLDGIHDIYKVMERAQRAQRAHLLRGAPRKGVDLRRLRRLIGDEGTLEDVPRQWAFFDSDKIPVACLGLTSDTQAALDRLEVPALEEMLRALWRYVAPEVWRDATVVAQLSSSAGLRGWDRVSAHFLVWLDHPRGREELDLVVHHAPHHQVTRSDGKVALVSALDPATNRTNQPLYTANPIFEGADDPLPQRLFLLGGTHDAVPTRWMDDAGEQWAELTSAHSCDLDGRDRGEVFRAVQRGEVEWGALRAQLHARAQARADEHKRAQEKLRAERDKRAEVMRKANVSRAAEVDAEVERLRRRYQEWARRDLDALLGALDPKDDRHNLVIRKGPGVLALANAIFEDADGLWHPVDAFTMEEARAELEAALRSAYESDAIYRSKNGPRTIAQVVEWALQRDTKRYNYKRKTKATRKGKPSPTPATSTAAGTASTPAASTAATPAASTAATPTASTSTTTAKATTTTQRASKRTKKKTRLRAVQLRKAGADVFVRSEGYFEPEDITGNARPRYIFLRGAQATGKTTAIGKLAARVRASGAAVLYVSHRQSLSRDVSTRLKLTCYLDTPSGALTLRPGDGLAVCLDSIERVRIPDETRLGLVIIDESEQVARHMYGDTIATRAEGASLAVYDALQRLIDRAQMVVAADADLDTPTHALVRGFVRSATREEHALERHVFHEKWIHRCVRVYDKSPDIMANVLSYLRSGPEHPVLIQCSSRSRAARVARILKDEGQVPELTENDRSEPVRSAARQVTRKMRPLRVLCITSETVNRTDVRTFLDAPNTTQERKQYDVIIASPTMGTGVSLEFPIARVYGLVSCVGDKLRGRTALDAAQQLWRARAVVPEPGAAHWHVWIQKREDTLDLTPKAVRDTFNARALPVESLRILFREKRGGVLELRGDDHFALCCLVTATANKWRDNLRRAWTRLCRERGYSVEKDEGADEKTRERFTKLDQDARKQLDQEEVTATFTAQVVTWEEAQAIAERGATTPEEAHVLSRARTVHALGLDATPEALEEKHVWQAHNGARSRGRLVAHVRMMLLLLAARPEGGSRPGCLSKELSKTHTPATTLNPLLSQAFLALVRSKVERCYEGGAWEVRAGSGEILSRAMALASLLDAAGLSWSRGWRRDEGISKASLVERGFLEWVRKRDKTLNAWGLLHKGWEEDPIRLLRRAVDRLGLKFNHRQRSKREGGRKIVWREYWLDAGEREVAERWSNATLRRLTAVLSPSASGHGPSTPPSSPSHLRAREASSPSPHEREEVEPRPAPLQGVTAAVQACRAALDHGTPPPSLPPNSHFIAREVLSVAHYLEGQGVSFDLARDLDTIESCAARGDDLAAFDAVERLRGAVSASPLWLPPGPDESKTWADFEPFEAPSHHPQQSN